MKTKKRVLIAMSGGVDSSCAALVLKESGFDVIGLTLRVWSRFGKDERPPEADVVKKARLSADKIGIELHIMDFRKAFEEEVIQPFCDEYLAGRTPNPCVECNRKIKFPALIRKAEDLKAYFIATGHYARIEKSGPDYLLKKAADTKKDQSYFLYTMTQPLLEKTLMPLGNLKKEEVRRLAEKAGLPAAQSPESQEICFIEDNDYRRFLSEKMPGIINPGDIKDKEGNFLGKHDGGAFYTIGQRRGLKLTSKKPYFVTGIIGNTIIAGVSEEVYKTKCRVSKVNLITGKLPPGGEAEVKIRHPGQPRAAKIKMLSETNAEIIFEKPKWAVTPGQSAVFYDGDTVIGGGIIQE
jgi:tRNA-uridine 2-sulfurtransferase